MDFLLGKALDDLRVSTPRHTAVDFDRSGEQRLVRRTAACRVVVGARRGNGCLVRLNNAVLRLAIWIDHGPAQLGTLHPGGLVGTQAEMPLESVATGNAAQNQVVSGSLLACMMVLAVTEVWRPQAAH